MTITTALPPRPAAEAGPTGGARSRTGNGPSAGAAAFADLLHSAPNGAADPAPTVNDTPTATPDPGRAPNAEDAAPLTDVPAETPAASSVETPAGAPTATPALQGLAFPLVLPGQAAGAGPESTLPASVPAPAPASAAIAAAAVATPGADGPSTAAGSPATAAVSAAAASSVAAPTVAPTPRAAAAAAAAAAASGAATVSSETTSPASSSSVPLGGAPAGAGAAPTPVPHVVPTPVAVPGATIAAATSATTPAAAETAAPDAGAPTPTSGERGTASVAWPLGTVAAPGAAPGAAPVASAGPVQAAPAPGTPLASQLVRPLFSLATAGPGEHTLSISVTPDNLGPVVVRAQISASGMRLELFAPTELARDALRLILPDLRRDLAGGGLPASLDLSTRSQPGEAGFSGRQDRPTPDLSGHAGAGFGSDDRGGQNGSRDSAAVNPWLRAASASLDATGPPEADSATATGLGSTGRVDVLA